MCPRRSPCRLGRYWNCRRGGCVSVVCVACQTLCATCGSVDVGEAIVTCDDGFQIVYSSSCCQFSTVLAGTIPRQRMDRVCRLLEVASNEVCVCFSCFAFRRRMWRVEPELG